MVSILLALSLPSAHAFAPGDDVHTAAEPNRLLQYHWGVQNRLRAGAAWQGFLAGDGAGWQARFDEVTGTPHRAWGPGIPLADVSDAAGVEASLREVFGHAQDLLGVPDAQLKLRSAGYVARTDTWYVDFDRMVPDGAGGARPIWGGGVTARVRGGLLVLFGVDTYPELEVLPGPQVPEAEAVETALLTGPAAMADHTDVWTELLVLPWAKDRPLELRLAYAVHSRTAAPVGRWVSLVDANTGEPLTVWNEVRFFTGTVYGTHDTRTVDGSMTTSPMPLTKLQGSDGSTEYAGEDGTYDLSDGASWTAALAGSYVTVNNSARGESDGSMAVSGSNPTWTTTYATQAEIDSYKFLHDVRTWGLAIAPEVGMVTDRFTSNVNINSSCNAYYDGSSVNFYESGGSCNNTGRIADVNYHEWGHGFHYTSLQAGRFDGSISEGIGDIVSSINTHDPEIGPYFYTNGRSIRDVSDNFVYPDDVTGEVHQDGLIFAGAVWDTWEALLGTYGETRADSGEAWTVASRLLADGIKAGPTIPDSYDEFVVADDDDGDVTNGTPHICEIVEGFGIHGLGPGGTEALLGMDHVPVGNQPANADVPIVASVLNLAPDCNSFDVSAATVHYSVNGGAWQEAPMGVAGEALDGVIPGLPDGSVVHYYVTATSADGQEVSQPADGVVAPYSFYVGGLVEVWCNDFEADDGGFQHELLAGDDREGADDWQWGRPNGEGGDPTTGASGRNVWGNDLGDGNYNGEYQASITNRLTSVDIDVGGASAVVVQFNRWLSVEDGEFDHARVYVNDTVQWENHEAPATEEDAATLDGEWKLHTIRVDDVSGPVSIAWEIESDRGAEYGGWTIDDVCVYTTVAYDALYAIDDFSASDDRVGEVQLSWTQPSAPDAVYARVIRRTDRFAQTRDDVGDGAVVFDGEVTPGSAQLLTDRSEGTYFYTAFAGGEAGWLSGAEDPGNADDGTGLGEGGGNGGDSGTDGTDGTDGTGENPEGGTIKINAGCGCATSSAPNGGAAAALLAALAGLAAARRRR